MFFNRSILFTLVYFMTFPTQSFSKSPSSPLVESYKMLLEQMASKEGLVLTSDLSGRSRVEFPKNSAVRLVTYRVLPRKIELEAFAPDGSLLRRSAIVLQLSHCRTFTCIHEELRGLIRPFVASLPSEALEWRSTSAIRVLIQLVLTTGHRSANASIEEALCLLLAAGAFLGVMGMVAGHTPLHPDKNSTQAGCLMFVVCTLGLLVGGCLFAEAPNATRYRVSAEQQRALEAAAEKGDMEAFLTILDEAIASGSGSG